MKISAGKWTLALALFSIAFGSSASAGWDGRWFDAVSGREVSEAEVVQAMSRRDDVVLGEKHNTPSVQGAQARIVREVVGALGAQRAFTLGWEFLNASDQALVTRSFGEFKTGGISGKQFLVATQGSDFNSSYLPILEAVKDLDGELRALNLTRQEKAPVVKGGIQAADPALIPPGFAMGSQGYHERFSETMSGGHATPEQIENYYAAQCLTDDVMATRIGSSASTDRIRFLVAGSFHTDYFDGTVGRMKIRAPERAVGVIRFIDATDYSAEELSELLPSMLKDSRYGAVADYVLFLGEPTAALR